MNIVFVKSWMRYRAALIGAALLVAVVPVYWLVATYVDHRGQAFYEAGKRAVDTLDRLSRALEKRDFTTVASCYEKDFRGTPLGVSDLRPAEIEDGVGIYRFHSETSAELDRNGAVDEWRAYLSRVGPIDTLASHVHRVESWGSGETVASVRFEMIATPAGEQRPAIDRGYFRMRFVTSDGVTRIREAELIEGHRVTGGRPHFNDVAASAGVDFENRYYPRFLQDDLKFAMLRYGPAGISAVDYDNDDFYDLFIPDGVESRLFRNRRDGTFEDVTEASGLAGLSGVSVGLFADYDNDGHKDFFVSRTFEPNQIFHNDGDGTFSDVTAFAGIGADCCTTAASWGDYDNDGLLDLYVCRYLEPHTEIPETFYARNGEPNQLYRNDGDGLFTNVTAAAGVAETGLCLGSVFGDYDDDGDADLYVVNDFGRNTLYRNEGDGTFADVTVETGTLAYGAGMNASFGDYDNDGKLDIYVTNIRSEYAWFGEPPVARRYMLTAWRQGVWSDDIHLYYEIFRQADMPFHKVFQQMGSGNTLLRNRGDGTFEDVTWHSRANPPGWFWGASFADFDNDGWQDLYAANGWVYNDPGTELELGFFEGVVADQALYKTGHFFDPSKFGSTSWHGFERNRHLRNNGDGTFTEIGLAAGSGILLNSRGVAVADFWNRGVLDIAVAASTDRHALLRNEIGVGRNWLAVETIGAGAALPDGTNRDGVGARVSLRAGNSRQMREVVLGDGYGSQNTLRVHFGLGPAETVDELEVFWPRSGRRQRFAAIPGNRIVRIREGDEALEVVSPEPSSAARD